MSSYYVPYGSAQPFPESSFALSLPWIDELVTRREDFNADHAQVLDRLNDLLSALAAHDTLRVSMSCAALMAATQAHFAAEEELMRSAGYPEGPAHVQQHADLMRRLAAIQAAAAVNPQAGAAYALPLLEQWFVPHIRYADRRVADYLESHVERQAA